MSTKTTFKRVALVTVAALGFGMLSVAPSFAATVATPAGYATSISLTKSSATTSGIGTEVTVAAAVTLPIATAITGGDTRVIPVVGTLISAPSNGATSVTTTAGSTSVPAVSSGTALAHAASANKVTITYATDSANTAAVVTTDTFKFTPSVAGTYVLRIWQDAVAATASAGDGVYTVGETYQDVTVTVGTANSALTDFGISTDATAATDGSLDGVRVSSVAATVIQPSGRVGVYGAFQPRFLLTRNAGAGLTDNNAGVSNATRSANLNYTVTNPAGTAVTAVTAVGGTTASAEQYVAGSSTAIASVLKAGAAQTSATHLAGDQLGSFVYFPTATAGTYTVTVWHDGNRDDLVSPGEAIAQTTFTVAADALPSITMTVTGNTTPVLSADGGQGQLLKVCLLNGTTPASLGASEALTISGDANTIFDNKSAMDTAGAEWGNLQMTAENAATVTLTSANFGANGCAYLNVGNTTAGGGTFTLTALIAGGTAAGASGSVAHTVLDATTYAVAATSALYGGLGAPITNANVPSLTAGTKGVKGANVAAADGARAVTWYTKRGVAQSVKASMVVGANASTSYTAVVTDTLGLITGVRGATYGLISTTGTTVTAATAVSFSVAMPAMTSSQTSAATLVVAGRDDTGNGASNVTITISNEAATPTVTYVNATQDSAAYSVRAAAAGSNKFTGTVYDQFGNVLPNIAVTSVITGRNALTVVPTLLSDANGQFSYTLTDVYTGTLLTTDTLTMTPAGAVAGVVTVNYATYLPASTIKLTTPDSANATATGIAGAIKTDISSADGAEAGAVDVTAVLKDANGATLPAGIAVTFTVTGNAGAAIVSTKKTVLTDAAGSATTSVYAWLNGNATVTATSGAATASGIVYFVQGSDGAEARTITAKAEGNVVTAKVTDRFGNAIKGVTVTASRVGSGTFNGTSSITGITDAAGSVDFVLTNGTADVTVSLPLTGNYSLASKGYTNAGITELTAYTAGTSTAAEEGVGASFDAAGVNSATVTVSDSTVQSAADAAAEATDAANAATDAANAAAEAADAATAAAQDAADAVAALSTQVTEMVSALKKQITALTNLVIKIQKKVKA